MKLIIVFLQLFLLSGCSYFFGSKEMLSQPPEAAIEIHDDRIATFSQEDVELLQRYLAGNSRWEIRKNNGQFYAIRREKVDGQYQTTLHGFYSTHSPEEGWSQTRLIISFGQPFGFGNKHDHITTVTAKKGETIQTIVEEPYSGTSGYSSYIILLGNGINIEIYDRSENLKREFTELAIASVNQEIRTALQHREAIRQHGKIPVPHLYPENAVSEPTFVVNDGKQRGIFLVEARVNPQEPGELYLKAFNRSTGEQLSEARMTPRSTRLASWSDDPNTLFPYNSEVTVYEGDWDRQYEARFELWHKNLAGDEKKVMETTRNIHGWER